jgi:hypothetical protein
VSDKLSGLDSRDRRRGHDLKVEAQVLSLVTAFGKHELNANAEVLRVFGQPRILRHKIRRSQQLDDKLHAGV